MFTPGVGRRHNRPATEDKTVDVMDLAEFDLNDMIECGRAVRKASESASSMEEAAGEIIRLFRRTLVDRQTGEANCPLLRCFKTQSLEPASRGTGADRTRLPERSTNISGLIYRALLCWRRREMPSPGMTGEARGATPQFH
jgi:hypothetical protein